MLQIPHVADDDGGLPGIPGFAGGDDAVFAAAGLTLHSLLQGEVERTGKGRPSHQQSGEGGEAFLKATRGKDSDSFHKRQHTRANGGGKSQIKLRPGRSVSTNRKAT